MLPCLTDKRGCLAVDPNVSEGHLRVTKAYEYLAESKGTAYKWRALQATAGGTLPADAVVAGHTSRGHPLLVAKLIVNGSLVLGHAALAGSVRMLGCDLAGNLFASQGRFQARHSLPIAIYRTFFLFVVVYVCCVSALCCVVLRPA